MGLPGAATLAAIDLALELAIVGERARRHGARRFRARARASMSTTWVSSDAGERRILARVQRAKPPGADHRRAHLIHRLVHREVPRHRPNRDSGIGAARACARVRESALARPRRRSSRRRSRSSSSIGRRADRGAIEAQVLARLGRLGDDQAAAARAPPRAAAPRRCLRPPRSRRPRRRAPPTAWPMSKRPSARITSKASFRSLSCAASGSGPAEPAAPGERVVEQRHRIDHRDSVGLRFRPRSRAAPRRR